MTRNEGHVDGEVAEFAVAADLVRKDCRVSYTHGLYKYDLVADKDDNLLRVQVKKANEISDKPWKYRIFTERYEEGQVDLFAGYIVDIDEVFYATYDDVGAKEFRINTKQRDELSDSNAKRAKLLEDYTFDRAIDILMDNGTTQDQEGTATMSSESRNK
ncbi:group I intron-associated PD-(D/E)XK endonuclease [Natrialbaceae archaeon A-gly3]